jgi:hypothetical protein
MFDDNNQRIRKRAYQIWEEQGCPEGLSTDHWLQAEGEIREEDAAEGAKAGSSTALTQTDEAETAAAGAASEIMMDVGTAVAGRLSKGGKLTQKPSGTRPGKRR